MTRCENLSVLFGGLLLGMVFCGATLAQTNVLIDENFDDPIFSVDTVNPAFSGWTYPATSYSSHSGGASDVPADAHPATNQVGKLNGQSPTSIMRYDTTFGWATNRAVTVILNASPMSWLGTSDRNIIVNICQTDGTLLWSGETPLPYYDNFGRNPWTAAQTFTFVALTDTFLGGAPGESLRLEITHGSTYSRGVYIDNVLMTEGPVPEDNDPPTPAPDFIYGPSADDYGAIAMEASIANDPLGVEYLFTNITRGTSSGWLDSPMWTEGGLESGALYTYVVAARDKSPNLNQTAFSSSSNVTSLVFPAGTIVRTGFQSPWYDTPNYVYPTLRPDFYGWTMNGSVRARNAIKSTDVPINETGNWTNQLVQFEFASDTAVYDSDYVWESGDYFALALNASSQNYGPTSERSIDLKILELDNTELWSTNIAIALYSTNNYGRNVWAPECTFSFDIAAENFSTNGTPGQMLRLQIGPTTGQRGVYFDNIEFVAVPPPPPEGTVLLLK